MLWAGRFGADPHWKYKYLSHLKIQASRWENVLFGVLSVPVVSLGCWLGTDTGSSWEPEPAWTGSRTALAVPTGSAQSITGVDDTQNTPKIRDVLTWAQGMPHHGLEMHPATAFSSLKYQLEPDLRVGENQLNSKELTKIPHKDTSGIGGRGL